METPELPTPEATEYSAPEASKPVFQLASIIETLLFITDRPLSLKRLGELAKEKNLSRIEEAINELAKNLKERNSALRILEIAGGFQMATQSEYSPFIRRLFADKMTLKLSRAAHETISIIAYRQPLTRAEIETIRGVDVIAALETLLEKKLIRVAGRKETIGRPLMYETTPDFLRHFGLKNLEELPPIENFEGQIAQTAPEPPTVQNEQPETPPISLAEEPTPEPQPELQVANPSEPPIPPENPAQE